METKYHNEEEEERNEHFEEINTSNFIERKPIDELEI